MQATTSCWGDRLKGGNNAMETSFRKNPVTIAKKVSGGRPRMNKSGGPRILLIKLITPNKSKIPMRKMPKMIRGMASLINELNLSQTFLKRIESFGTR